MKVKLITRIVWVLITTLIIPTSPGCTKNHGVDGPPVSIRVKNISDFNFDALTIWSDTLGPLASDSYTPYFIKEPAYDKASIYVEVDTLQFGLTVIDYVGESPLKQGKYTFEVDVSELSKYGFLTQKLIRD